MWIVDTPITKQYWEPFFNFIVKNIHKGAFTKIPKAPVVKIKWGRHVLYVAVMGKSDAYEVIGWLYLGHPKKDWVCWQVEQSYVFNRFRGQGWGKILYKTVIDREGLILSSGSQQTRTGRAMWKSMIAQGQYTIWAHDFTSDVCAAVTYDKDADELWSALQVYQNRRTLRQLRRADLMRETQRTRADVRLIAIRKSK